MRDRLVGVAIGIGVCGLVAGMSAWAAQRHMHDALDHLRQARHSLQQAEGNKGGHRENAIDLVDKAINQVERGMEFAAEG